MRIISCSFCISRSQREDFQPEVSSQLVYNYYWKGFQEERRWWSCLGGKETRLKLLALVAYSGLIIQRTSTSSLPIDCFAGSRLIQSLGLGIYYSKKVLSTLWLEEERHGFYD